jgi:hypothetical protein
MQQGVHLVKEWHLKQDLNHQLSQKAYQNEVFSKADNLSQQFEGIKGRLTFRTPINRCICGFPFGYIAFSQIIKGVAMPEKSQYIF